MEASPSSATVGHAVGVNERMRGSHVLAPTYEMDGTVSSLTAVWGVRGRETGSKWKAAKAL